MTHSPILVAAALALLGAACASTSPSHSGDQEPTGTWIAEGGPTRAQLSLRPDHTATFHSGGDLPALDFQGTWQRNDGGVMVTENARRRGNPPPAQRVLVLTPGAAGTLRGMIDDHPFELRRAAASP